MTPTTEKVVKQGRLRIGDLDKAIYHLGNVYDDPRDALAEFVTNAIDADAEHVIIRLNRRARVATIEVQDDGSGMTSQELDRVANHLCDSVKADDERTVGEKGIGVLGYQEIAEKCELVSRAKGEQNTHVLRLRRGTSMYDIARAEKRHQLEIPGTTVRLVGIDKQRMRQFTLAKIEEHMKKKFRGHLASRRVTLTLVEGKEARHVQPDTYKGFPFYESEATTPYGRITFSLYINPNARSETVAVYHKGNLVTPDIAQLDEFDGDPWTSGKVVGEISNDFCKVTTGRSGFVQDRYKWPSWVAAVKAIEQALAAEVERLAREASQEANRQMVKRIREAFLKALRDLPSWGGINAPIAAEDGAPSNGKVKNDDELSPNDPNGRGRGRRASQERPPVLPGTDPVRSRSGIGFNLIEIPMEDKPDVHSDFDHNTVIIRVNTLHPDFARESETQARKESYLVRLISKEMTLYEYPDTSPDNLLEKALDLELAARRHLDLRGRLTG
jgi:anti-sigma regulatory factor (Ser/Thr protein kinase)